MLKCVLGDRVIRVRRSVLGAGKSSKSFTPPFTKILLCLDQVLLLSQTQTHASISKENRVVASSTMTFHSVGWDDDDRGA